MEEYNIWRIRGYVGLNDFDSEEDFNFDKKFIFDKEFTKYDVEVLLFNILGRNHRVVVLRVEKEVE